MKVSTRKKLVLLSASGTIVLFAATIVFDWPVKDVSRPLYGSVAFICLIGLLSLVFEK